MFYAVKNLTQKTIIFSKYYFFLIFFFIGPILAFYVKIMAVFLYLPKNELSNIKNVSHFSISDILFLFIKELTHLPPDSGLKRRGFK